jgi:hypothetical protein
VDAFCRAGMILETSAISPQIPQTEMVFSNGGGGAQDEDEEVGDEIFGQAVQDSQEEGEAKHPDGVEVTLSDGEDIDETVKQRILPDPGEPTASQREDHRASGHITYRSWCEECVAGRATGEQHRRRKEARRVCIFAFDYLFLDKSGALLQREAISSGVDVDLTISVAKDLMG